MNISVPDWVKGSIFYLIFPDRFAKQKPSNLEDWESPPTRYGFKGGDLPGITDKLDYIQDLGINALILNPIFTSAANHRYHTIDYYSVDPILGGNQALRKLLDAAHAKGMRVILDGVFNHCGRGFYQFNHTLENGATSPYLNWFHFNQTWLKEGRQIDAFPKNFKELEQDDGTLGLETYGYKCWWNLPALPKFNTNNPEVRKCLLDVAKFWLDFGADGWRLDVPSEIDDDSFWQEFRQVVKSTNPDAYIVGEIWEDARRWLKGDQFDAAMNYLLTKLVVGYFGARKLNTDIISRTGSYKEVRAFSDQEFSNGIKVLLSMYDPEITQVQLNLLSSHDTPRFLSCAGGDESALRLALLFLCTFPGAPCIYYGDEIGLLGGPDPDCRRAFPWNEGKWNKHLRSTFKKYIELRKQHTALRRGAFKELLAKDSIFAFERNFEAETIIVVLNLSDDLRSVDLLAAENANFQDLYSTNVFSSNRGVLQGLSLTPRSGLVIKRLDS